MRNYPSYSHDEDLLKQLDNQHDAVNKRTAIILRMGERKVLDEIYLETSRLLNAGNANESMGEKK